MSSGADWFMNKVGAKSKKQAKEVRLERAPSPAQIEEVVQLMEDAAGQRCNRKLKQWSENVMVWDVQRCASEMVPVPRFKLERAT